MTHVASRRDFLKRVGIGSAALLLPGANGVPACLAGDDLPNIVVIFTDDQGYSDLGSYGAEGFRTPNIDGVAAAGVRFTDFYVAQPVCGASRAALLTGCYPNRIGLTGAPNHNARHGIHDDEMTLAELVKQRGYATAIFGKWHLGHRPPFLPTRHGFDEYFGLPYSNDMWPCHPRGGKGYPPLPLVKGEKTIALNPDQTRLTGWYTERAVRFIRENRERPFFLYVPHSMAHVPLHVSGEFKGKSRQGAYGDVIEEIDWSVGEILKTLRETGIEDRTLVIFTSDNGPWLSYGNHAGTARPLREGKATTFEGGVRVPCVMQWPGRIPAGSICSEPAMTIDIVPTVARLIEGRLPSHGVDGKDIWPLISGEPGARSPHEALYFYYRGNDLEALRSGRWKLIFPHKYNSLTGKPGRDGHPAGYTRQETPLALYDLIEDVGEEHDVATEFPDVVKRLEALAEKARDDMGDSLRGRKGRNRRPSGRIR